MMISLLICSRISGNKNWGLFNLLDSLTTMSTNYRDFEVLVKFDDDDGDVKKILPKLKAYPFAIKYLIEPRGRGYIDIHIGYNRLLSLIDERSIIIGAMADDFEITQQGWDMIVLSKCNQFEDNIFLVHGIPHPPYYRDHYEEQKFFLDFDIDRIDDIEIIDEAPLWSRKLLEICGGLGLLSFTDAWTLMLEYYLNHRCGLNRTVFLDRPIIHRRIHDDVDKVYSPRWLTDRAINFTFAKSTFYNSLVEQQALNIYSFISIRERSLLPPPIEKKNFSIEIRKIIIPPPPPPKPWSERMKESLRTFAPQGYEIAGYWVHTIKLRLRTNEKKKE